MLTLFDLAVSRARVGSPRAVLIQLGLMIAVSAFTLLMFSILRPNNSIVYQPKIKYATDDKLPPIISRGFFSWIKPSTQTTEDSLMRTIGLDGVCFLRFLRMCRNLFTIVSVVACAGLFPIDIIYNLNNVPGAERNFFSILTIQVSCLSLLLYSTAHHLDSDAVMRLRKESRAARLVSDSDDIDLSCSVGI